MHDTPWKKARIKLTERQNWVARPGCKSLVMQGGAVRFDFPEAWVVSTADDCIQLHDKKPPDDNCRLAVSFMQLPPVDFSGLPVMELVQGAADVDQRPILSRGEIQPERIGQVELAWRETRFTDELQNAEAHSLFCLARKGRVQAIITFDFWPKDRERCLRIWRTVLNTLELDAKLDPKTGKMIG